MTAAGPARLTLLPAEREGEEVSRAALVGVDGIAPDDGAVAHPALSPHLGLGVRTDPVAAVAGHVCDLLEAPGTASAVVLATPEDTALAVLRAARDARPWLRRPTVVLPSSADHAFLDAADALGVVPVVVPVDHAGRAAVGPMASALGEGTVLVVASAPAAHGGVDPVAWLAAAATARDVPLHVDATSGGWLLAHAAPGGRPLPSWGFEVPGVASVAVGVGPGRAPLTVLVHRVDADVVAAAAAPRLVADVAETLDEVAPATFAALARDALAALDVLRVGLSDVPGIAVIGSPEAAALAVRADRTCDVFTLADELRVRGWHATTQPHGPHGPATLRFEVPPALEPLAERCLADWQEAVAAARGRGRGVADPTLAGMLRSLHPEHGQPQLALRMLEVAAVLDDGSATGPGSTAATDLLLDAAEPEARRALQVARRRLAQRPARSRAAQEPASASTSASV